MLSKFQKLKVKIKTWIRNRKDPVHFVHFEKNGKKYLVVTFIDGIRVKWQYRYEIITECDEYLNPIPTKFRNIDY